MRLLLVFAVAAPLFAQNPCPYELTPSPSQTVNIPASSSTNEVWVFADGDPNGCNWTYSTDSPSWITFTSGPAKGMGYGDDTFYWSAAANVSPTVRQAKISVTGATGNGGIGYSVPANSGPQRTGHITGQPGPWVVTVTQQALPPPAMQLNAMVNAASNAAGAVSPGGIVTLYSANIGPASPAGFQVNAVAPYGLAPGATTQVQVEYQGVLSNALSVPVQAAHPGLFTVDSSGLGSGAILNQDDSLNGGFNPAARGSYVMIYSTGGGVTNPPSADATITPAPPPLYLLKTTPVSVAIGGIAVTLVSYSGAAPSQIAGLTQINAQVPAGVTPGTKVPVTVTIGTWQSQPGVTMAVK